MVPMRNPRPGVEPEWAPSQEWFRRGTQDLAWNPNGRHPRNGCGCEPRARRGSREVVIPGMVTGRKPRPGVGAELEAIPGMVPARNPRPGVEPEWDASQEWSRRGTQDPAWNP